ncbi:MAG: hypothetical protein QXH91_08765, partial [Candidatus Bathyarchaeia archaeon]
DFVETCFKTINGNLTKIDIEEGASVVTYAMPMTYGKYRTRFSGSSQVDLTGAYKLKETYGDKIRIYPGSMELREDGLTYALKSRAVAVVGVGEDLPRARKISLEGITNIDGPLWNRWDIASIEHIERSIAHLKDLRIWPGEEYGFQTVKDQYLKMIMHSSWHNILFQTGTNFSHL